MSRARVRDFVESRGFRIFIFIVILVNSTTIGIEISHADSLMAHQRDVMLALELFDFVCLLIYIAEAAMKLYAYRLNYFKSGWNLFDFSIILLSLLPALGALPVPVQFLRIIRLVRIVRILKLISLFEQMHIIVEAIGKSISGVIWTALLLLVVIYVFDVIGVALFSEIRPDLFGSLALGAITLVEAALSGWPDFAHDIAVEHPFGYVYFISYIVCSALIVLNVVVGIIVDAIQSSAQAERDEEARGLEPVNTKDHVVLLGFNPTTLAILGEVIEANANQEKTQTVVILDDVDKTDMERAVDEEFGPALATNATSVLCRTGSVYDISALERCSVASSKAVIANAGDDFGVIRAIMACVHSMRNAPGGCSSYVIATVQDERNEAAAKIAGHDDMESDFLELISMQSVLARIMVNASRQPGLSAAFTELFNFAGNEFYIIDDDASYSRLHGKTIAEVNLFLKSAFAIGTMREGRVLIGNPNDVRFCEGDALILVEEDDDALEVLRHEARVQDVGLASGVPDQTMRALVLGDYPIFQNVLREYAHYLSEGSEIMLVDPHLDGASHRFDQVVVLLAERGISFSARCVNIYDKASLDGLLADFDPHGVLVLGDLDADAPEQEDKRIFELILYLRNYRERASHGFGITCQINSEANRELVDITGSDDYIVSKHFAALLMAQISQKREMAELCGIILSSEGFEVYIKRASHYVPLGVELDLYTLGAAVAKRGEILIGLRQKQGGCYRDPIINPAKYEEDGSLKTYRFTEDDYLVVLAEDISFSA